MFKKNYLILLLILMNFFIEISFAQYSNVVDTKTEEHDEKKLETVLNDYNQKNQNPNNVAAQEIKDVSDEELTEEELREFDDFSNAVKKEGNAKNIPNYKKELVPKNLEERKLSENINFMLSPLKSLSDKELENLLREKIKESGAQKLYDLEPRIYPFTVKIIKDNEALPALIRISEDIVRLTKLVWLIIATFVVGYFFKRITSNKGQPFITALCFGFIRLTLMMGLRIFIVWWIFSNELRPAVRIFKEVFFS